MLKVLVSRQGDCLSTRIGKAFRRVRAVVSGDHIDHVVAREGEGSVEADQIHRDKLWRVTDIDALTVVDKVVSYVRGLIVMEVGNSTVVSIAEDVQESEFTENETVRARREHL